MTEKKSKEIAPKTKIVAHDTTNKAADKLPSVTAPPKKKSGSFF